MRTQEEISARLGHSVVALASLCLVLAAIIILMLNKRYTTDIEMAVNGMEPSPPSVNNTPAEDYTPGANNIDGRKLFNQNCAVCHSTGTIRINGPGLAGVTGRVPSEEWMHKWIKDPDGLKKSGDPYAVKIDKENASNMTPFGFLRDDEVDAIIDYIKAATE
jgi:mono/diheme cytochrome c family protein